MREHLEMLRSEIERANATDFKVLRHNVHAHIRNTMMNYEQTSELTLCETNVVNAGTRLVRAFERSGPFAMTSPEIETARKAALSEIQNLMRLLTSAKPSAYARALGLA